MALLQTITIFVLISLTAATPTTQTQFWKNTFLNSSVEEMRSLCATDDPIACLKYKFMSIIDTFFQKDSYQISDNVEVQRNSFRSNEVTKRSETSLEDNVKEYLQSHDVTFKLPLVDSSITIGAQNLEQDELDVKVKFSSGQVEARKSKLKKIIVPIFIFILLKAITLIPLALGVLGLKAWNALQLSFFSFVVSIALAVFQLCKKIAADNVHAPIATHGPWDAHYARSFDVQPNFINEEAQNLAYAAYV